MVDYADNDRSFRDTSKQNFDSNISDNRVASGLDPWEPKIKGS